MTGWIVGGLVLLVILCLVILCVAFYYTGHDAGERSTCSRCQERAQHPRELREVLATREKDRDRRVLDYVKAGVAHYSAQQKVEEEMRKESDEALKAL